MVLGQNFLLHCVSDLPEFVYEHDAYFFRAMEATAAGRELGKNGRPPYLNNEDEISLAAELRRDAHVGRAAKLSDVLAKMEATKCESLKKVGKSTLAVNPPSLRQAKRFMKALNIKKVNKPDVQNLKREEVIFFLVCFMLPGRHGPQKRNFSGCDGRGSL